MPLKSAKQFRFMQMAAHNPDKSVASTGPSPAVAKEMIAKTPKKKKHAFAIAFGKSGKK